MAFDFLRLHGFFDDRADIVFDFFYGAGGNRLLVNILHFNAVARDEIEVEFKQFRPVERLHAVEDKIIQLFGGVDGGAIKVSAADIIARSGKTLHIACDGTFHHLVGEIIAS